jgi:anaerobic ribonucleoside-triphosphate reductase activating protein
LLDYAGCAAPVEGLGPGKRAVIWVRGCDRRCAGCIAPELWEPGDSTPVDEIAAVLLPLLDSVDGLTISGGEPFAQAPALRALLAVLRAQREVEVLVYSGYQREELVAQGGAAAALLEEIDILIDGAFLADAPNTLQWRGSDNQRVHLLSTRAQRYRGATEQSMPDQRPLRVQMTGPTRYRIIGIPRRGDLALYRAMLAARGLEVRPDNG